MSCYAKTRNESVKSKRKRVVIKQENVDYWGGWRCCCVVSLENLYYRLIKPGRKQLLRAAQLLFAAADRV
jgi:hypothetical protein